MIGKENVYEICICIMQMKQLQLSVRKNLKIQKTLKIQSRKKCISENIKNKKLNKYDKINSLNYQKKKNSLGLKVN